VYGRRVDGLELAEAAVAEGEPPGAVVVLADGRAESVVHCFGTTERGGDRRVGPRTIFRLASVSKVVTALAAAVAVREGLLDLDASVTTYLPDLRLKSRFGDDRAETERITPRHLLSHMAGLPRQARVGNGVADWPAHVRSIGECWMRFPVGHRMGYSDIGPDLLGHVLEVVSGETFPSFVADRILGPLGMDDATFEPAVAVTRPDRAHGYVGGPAAPISGTVPAGSLYASGRDIGRLLRFVLASELVHELATIPFPAPGQTEGYALGMRWQRTEWNELALGHAGSGYGFLTDLWWLPDSGVGAALLTSSQDHALRGRVVWDVLRPHGRPSAPPPVDPTPGGARADTALAGSYLDPVYGSLVVEEQDGRLGLAGETFRQLDFVDAHEAVAHGTGERYRFVRRDGNAPQQILRVRDGAGWAYNVGPTDAAGPDDPAWSAHEGWYEADRPFRVERRNGHLHALDRRLEPHTDGVFFTPSGFAVEFEPGGVWFANRFCPRRSHDLPWGAMEHEGEAVAAEAEPGQVAHDPVTPQALADFMAQGWAPAQPLADGPSAAAPFLAARRAALSEAFPGEWLVVPTGNPKVRANDTDYPFRPGTDFYWLTGSMEPDAVLVMAPVEGGHEATLYTAPRMDRSTPAFFTDRRYGELWVGPRLGLEAEVLLGITCDDVATLPAVLDSLPEGASARVLRGFDAAVDARVPDRDDDHDKAFATALSELRLVKDEHEAELLQEAVDATIRGFEDAVAALGEAKRFEHNGERWIEGTFFRRARVEGNDVGYGSIVACGAHACTLHWVDNRGAVRDGDLALLDMGVESAELYTADVTRTLPINGRFTDVQRDVYDAVWRAQQAALAEVRPGAEFLAPHRAAMAVLVDWLLERGILTGEASDILDEKAQLHRRYTLHGTSHMLGLDVHDCAEARNEMYRKGPLEVGYCLTVEPGLYFQPDDLTVAAEYRGIGVRIEDDVLVTADGHRNLSAALPTRADDVEAWMAGILSASRSTGSSGSPAS
jgi:Xaa-Pro aminopeptidase